MYQLAYSCLTDNSNSKDLDAGPSGFEPETAGSLSFVKSPVLYLAELRAHRAVS